MVPKNASDTSSTGLPPTFGRPHVVLVGAGASRAACPDGDKNGRKLPLMNDLIEAVGLQSLLEEHGLTARGKNFEKLYSFLSVSGDYDEVLYTVESAVHAYFAQLLLPEYPTLYDHMLLCLRRKDLIATFNWDPLLPQAMHRVAKRFGEDVLPQVFFLHGNVRMGYCDQHETPTEGFLGNRCSRCGAPLVRSDILFPVTEKDYTDNPFISHSWEYLRRHLNDAFILTIFGYRAPETDINAAQLIKKAWGSGASRELEQIEIIDIRPVQELHKNWEAMICREHYGIMDEFYHSLAARHPRRSCEDFWEAIIQSNPQQERPIPHEASWRELEDWAGPLLEQERKQN